MALYFRAGVFEQDEVPKTCRTHVGLHFHFLELHFDQLLKATKRRVSCLVFGFSHFPFSHVACMHVEHSL